jgi:hypothetical protein
VPIVAEFIMLKSPLYGNVKEIDHLAKEVLENSAKRQKKE